ARAGARMAAAGLPRPGLLPLPGRLGGRPVTAPPHDAASPPPSVRAFSPRYAPSTSGVGSAPATREPLISQAGGSSVPASAQAAWRAAPSATYSAGGAKVTSRPNTAGASSCTARFYAAPPVPVVRAPEVRV